MSADFFNTVKLHDLVRNIKDSLLLIMRYQTVLVHFGFYPVQLSIFLKLLSVSFSQHLYSNLSTKNFFNFKCIPANCTSMILTSFSFPCHFLSISLIFRKKPSFLKGLKTKHKSTMFKSKYQNLNPTSEILQKGKDNQI